MTYHTNPGMDDAVIGVLRGLLAIHGDDLLDEPRKLETLLRDACGPRHREVGAIIAALRSNVPRALQSRSGEAAALLYERLARRILEDHHLEPEEARWSVFAWDNVLSRTNQSVTTQPAPVEPPHPVPRRTARDDVFVRERFRPVLTGCITLLAPGGLVLLIPAGLSLVEAARGGAPNAAWGFLIFLAVVGVVLVLVGLLAGWHLFSYLVYGKGPPKIALRRDAITDHRYEPPLVIPWDQIESVEVGYQSSNREVLERRVLVKLLDGNRYELNLLEMDRGPWELARLMRERFQEARGIAPVALKGDGLGALVQVFRGGGEGRHLPLVAGLISLVFGVILTFVSLKEATGAVLWWGLGLAVFGAVTFGYGTYRLLDLIKVYERAVVSWGLLFSYTDRYSDMVGVLIHSVNHIPGAVILKFGNGGRRKILTSSTAVTELAALISSRV